MHWAADGRAAAAARRGALADLLAVGMVHGDRMIIHVSRLLDNAPVRDAVVTVLLRGATHPTTAESDGSYTLRTQDLALPGAAAVEFQVKPGSGARRLKGTLGDRGRSAVRRTTETTAASYGGGC